jgi:RNA polymerase sigma factor (sigma-70 family)
LNRAASEAFCRRFLPQVRGMVAVRLGRTLVDASDADDIVQETLLEALGRLPQFEYRSTGALVHWLGKLAESRIHTAMRRGRAGKRGGGAVVRRADLEISTVSALVGAQPGPSPSQVVSASEYDGPLERALLALGQPRREIVYCRLVLEMEFSEIAASLEIDNVDSVRAQFHRAIGELRGRVGNAPPA